MITTTQTRLATLVRNLLAADNALTAYIAHGRMEESEFTRLEGALFAARHAFLSYMQAEHGLTKREVEMLGGAV